MDHYLPLLPSCKASIQSAPRLFCDWPITCMQCRMQSGTSQKSVNRNPCSLYKRHTARVYTTHMLVRINFQMRRNALISDHRQHMRTSRCKHSSVQMTRRPSPASSVICVLPWTTTLHLARLTPLCTHS